MAKLFATVTRKMTIGYLLIVIFSLSGIGLALQRLHLQTRRTEQLVNVEFRGFELVRDLRQNLLAQENIEKQLLILRDPALQELRTNRNEGLAQIYHAMANIPGRAIFTVLQEPLNRYRLASGQLSDALVAADWAQVQQLSAEQTTPLRSHLLEQLTELRNEQQQNINSDLSSLSTQASDAYQLTLLMTLLGIGLSAPVALTLVLTIRRSIKTLQTATREISSGSFEHQPQLTGHDEFSQLARDFTQMGQKLRELEQLRLDANPLTRLPGNLAIDREVDRRISARSTFAHLYIDLDNFKVYSDRYGYKAGSDVLAQVGQLIQRVVREQGTETDLVGHIGGDDYVVITTLDHAELLAEQIIAEFTKLVPSLYSEEDRRAGKVRGLDRYGVEREFPLMTMSIAIIHSDHYEQPSRLAISQDCARLKTFLKEKQGSNYMLDRRS